MEKETLKASFQRGKLYRQTYSGLVGSWSEICTYLPALLSVEQEDNDTILRIAETTKISFSNDVIAITDSLNKWLPNPSDDEKLLTKEDESGIRRRFRTQQVVQPSPGNTKVLYLHYLFEISGRRTEYRVLELTLPCTHPNFPQLILRLIQSNIPPFTSEPHPITLLPPSSPTTSSKSAPLNNNVGTRTTPSATAEEINTSSSNNNNSSSGNNSSGSGAVNVSKRKYLFVINPFSGTKRSKIVFFHQIYPILTMLNAPFHILFTKHSSHAFHFMLSMPLNKILSYSSIISVSGDGLLFEIVNGVMYRPDWLQVTKTVRFGIIPAGSGNSLANTIGLRNPLRALAAILFGSWSHLDVFSVESFPKKESKNQNVSKQTMTTQPVVSKDKDDLKMKRIKFGFVSVGWGIMSDVDIESERYRWMGETRFTVSAVQRIVGLRRYKGKLSYIPSNVGDGVNLKKNPVKMDGIGTIYKSSMHAQPLHEQTNNVTPTENNTITSTVPTQQQEQEQEQEDEKTEDKNKDKDKVEDSTTTEAAELSTENISATGAQEPIKDEREDKTSEDEDLEGDYPASLRYLKSLNNSKEEWEVIEGDFISFIATQLTDLSSSIIGAPNSSINDGAIDIMWIYEDKDVKKKKAVGKFKMLSMLTRMEDGSHTTLEELNYVKAKSFILEPGENEGMSGIIAVDGERVEQAAVRVDIFNKVLKIHVNPSGRKHS